MKKRWINLWRAGGLLSTKEIRVINGERRLYEKLRRNNNDINETIQMS